MKVDVKAISAFTIDGQGGNIAGVVLDADQYTAQEKQQIAANANFSETVFVSNSGMADFKLDFYTPIMQIAHCGHATIATFSYLKANGRICGNNSSKQTVDGIREIFFEGELAFMEQKPQKWEYYPNISEIASSLNIAEKDIKGSPVIVNTGNSFLIVEAFSQKQLADIMPDFKQITDISEKNGLIGFYLFVKTPESDAIATTRMFAPFYGIDEESATGMAAGPLAWWLYLQDPAIGKEFMIRQGDFMEVPSSSNLHVIINRGINTPNIFVGGSGSFMYNLVVEI
ncbi:MAG TPA: PhzF family phenazine biosynthesis protein [Flavobacterium sp.]|jgi:PhzF family phenazine biosynthesis protein